jgi:response regulator RpfG family c-di-GMP phosphodiesterase
MARPPRQPVNYAREEPRSSFSPRVIAVVLILLFIGLGWTFFWLLMDEKNILRDSREDTLETNGQLALSLCRMLYLREQAGELSTPEARQQAVSMLREMRYGSQYSQYYYILDTRGYMVMHPLRPDLEGTDTSTLTDLRNKPFINDLVLATSGQQTSGMVSYFWHWIGSSSTDSSHLAFATRFEPWGWVIVTEVTTTDIDDLITAELGQQALALTFICVVLAFILAVTLRRLVLSGVDSLISVTRRLRQGDLSARVNLNPMDEMGVLAESINQMAAGLQARNIQIRQTQRAAVFALAKLAEARDNETGEHLLRVREYAARLARALSQRQPWEVLIDDAFVEQIFDAVMLHDIGKVAIPDSILLKPDTLDDKERATMMSHTLIGARTIRLARQRMQVDSGFLHMAEQIARSHHECWDGSGYVEQLRGEEIPLPSRIFSIVDVYDALTTRRPYKPAYAHDQALEMMATERGRRFDPAIFDVFLSIAPEMDQLRREFSEEYEDQRSQPMQVHELL